VQPASLFVIAALFAIQSAAAEPSSTPFLVVNIDERFLADPVILGFFADVLRKGGLGYRKSESAAFLVRETGGGYRCVTWPSVGEVQVQRFTGTAPDGTVAIVHTHPESLPDPSSGDRQVAMSAGVPVFVVTRRAITSALADGSVKPVIEGRLWSSSVRGPARCEPSGR
jgi:proteasome lid subunit RPN8/RPN11